MDCAGHLRRCADSGAAAPLAAQQLHIPVIGAGFSIFLLSDFPPTQRFGLFVMFGSATAATAALFLFPWLASLRLRARTGAQYRKAA